MSRAYDISKFCDARGWSVNDIYHMVPKEQRCQVNYSILHPGVVKAWHRHKNQDDYFFVIKGMAQVGIYSDENGAEKHFIGEHNPQVIHIKAGEWHGLTPIGTEPVGLLYFVTNNYNPDLPDEQRTEFDSFVGIDWWKPENK